MQVALGCDALGAAQNILGRRLGNPLDHLQVHECGVELPNLFVVGPQIQVGDSLAERGEEELEHAMRWIGGVGIFEKCVEAKVAVVGREGRKLVLERVFYKTPVVKNPVRPPQLVDVFAEDIDHQVEDGLVFREQDVRADIVVHALERK